MWARAVSAIIFAVFATATSAQTSNTDNLVYTSVNPAPTGTNIGQSWTGFITSTTTGGGTTGGTVPAYNLDNGTFYFGYVQGTVAYTYAINQALATAGTGIRVQGYNYSWDIYNNNANRADQFGIDTLTARITTYGANNSTVLQQDSWTYNTKFDWTTFSGTVNYTNPGLVSEYGNMRIEFTGMDSGYWAGYYGPQVRNIDVSLRYSVDPCVADPQSSPACPGFRTYYNNMWDDGYAIVNLPFTFPFYGRTFTTSVMYTNGVVGFLDPVPGGFCCDGTDLNQQRFVPNSPWNYAIYALNTDLIPGANSRFYTQQTDGGTGLRYTWEIVPEIGTNLNNTFSVNIKDSGYIGITYDQINLNAWRQPLIGIAGDISAGQYYQKHYGPASTMTATAGTTYTFTGTETTDVCAQNPLFNPQCPGYAAAYLAQQCSISALYDPACPGYAAAYLTYQCNISQLYSPSCPGYQQAYFDQQCSLDPLYNNQCPGYQQAYFNQQCSLDGLYDTACPNYADAYYVQQCTADPLYDSGCTGYAEAYALKYVVNAPVSTPTTETVVVATTSDPVASAAPVVADPIVNQAVTTTATSASPAQAATATVPLVPAPQPVTTTVAAASEPAKEEPRAETASTESSSSTATTSASSDSKEQPKTTRQALAERRLAAARAKAVEAGKELAGKMGEAASMEAQVAVQNVVVQAMGFTPGFDAYGKVVLPDVAGYKPFEIYQGQKNVDNPAGRRFLTGSDRLHTEMVDQQWGGLER